MSKVRYSFSMVQSREKLGLVMSGGGARSAYQAGVMVGIQKVAEQEKLEDRLKFSVFSGISGGAINATYLASHATEWSNSVERLWQQWENLTLDAVVNLDAFSMLSRASKILSQLGTGGRTFGWKKSSELLNAEPLKKMLNESSDFAKLRENFAKGHVHGLGLTATHYSNGTSVTFYEGSETIVPWTRRNRVGCPAKLDASYVLASAAIPFLFPPVSIGGAFYGDGAMRMSAPLSPAIHMGADRLLAIGVRYYRPEEEVRARIDSTRMKGISLADIAGATLNALFLDAVDSDVERLERINRTLALSHKDFRHPEALRQIPVLIIRPSQDLGLLAKGQLSKFSWTLRHLLRGLGSTEERGSDLISYLAFDKSYTTQLLELGLKDAVSHRTAILEWLNKN